MACDGRAPAGPRPDAPTAPLQASTGDTVAALMFIRARAPWPVDTTRMRARLGATAVPILPDSNDASQFKVVVPLGLEGTRDLALIDKRDSVLAKRSWLIVPSIPAMERRGAQQLDSLRTVLTALRAVALQLRVPTPELSDSLALRPIGAALDSATALLLRVMDASAPDARSAIARLLVSEAPHAVSALARTTSVLASSLRSQREARLATRLSRALSSAATVTSLSSCEATLLSMDQRLGDLHDTMQDLALVLIGIGGALPVFVATSVTPPGALVMAGTLMVGMGTAAAIVTLVLELSELIDQAKRSNWAPVPGANAWLEFAPYKVPAGTSAAARLFVNTQPLFNRLDEFGPRLASTLGLVTSTVAVLRKLAGVAAKIESLIGASGLAQALLDRATSLTNLVANLNISVHFIDPQVSALQQDGNLTFSPVDPADEWRLDIPAGDTQGTLTTRRTAPSQTITFTIDGKLREASSYFRRCRVASIAARDPGINRAAIEAPLPGIVLEGNGRAVHTGDYARVKAEKTFVLPPAAPGSWSLFVESPASLDPQRFGSSSNTGAIEATKMTAKLTARQTWDHRGGATWNWTSFVSEATFVVWVEATITKQDQVWMRLSGSSQVILPQNANGFILSAKGRRSLVTESFADSMQLSRLGSVSTTIDGKRYFQYSGVSARVTTGYGSTCIIAACGKGPFNETPSADLSLTVEVDVRRATP